MRSSITLDLMFTESSSSTTYTSIAQLKCPCHFLKKYTHTACNWVRNKKSSPCSHRWQASQCAPAIPDSGPSRHIRSNGLPSHLRASHETPKSSGLSNLSTRLLPSISNIILQDLCSGKTGFTSFGFPLK